MSIITGIILGIIGLVAAGVVVGYAIIVTFRWLLRKIKEKLAARSAKKVAVADLEKLIDNCDNRVSLSDLENLTDQGYTHLVATVDKSNRVNDVEVIKDTSNNIDTEVEHFINRTRSGMVIVED